MRCFLIALSACCALWSPAAADEALPVVAPLFRAVDLNLGETAEVTLCDGSKATVKLAGLEEQRDSVCGAMRAAKVQVEVNGQPTTLEVSGYNLPATFGGVQIDCPITKGWTHQGFNPWTLLKDARLRLWPAGSPWYQPGTFVYPIKQKWFANATQMGNEPVYVDRAERPNNPKIRYHWCLDFGGPDAVWDVFSATDGVVVTAGDELPNPRNYPSVVEPRYDVVYIKDGYGNYYRYAHLDSIDPAMQLGARVKMGQKVGVLGRQGSSGGWAHLHFDISGVQPNGKYGSIDGYAFIWQAYRAEHDLNLQAVARPHQIAWIGESITLDGSRSWSLEGPGHIKSYEWLFDDGTTAAGPRVSRSYAKAGTYSEMLKVTDADGQVSYDPCVVQIFDRKPVGGTRAPTIHAAYSPTLDLKAGDEVTFFVRSFGIDASDGKELWDFGDGSPKVEVQSDGCNPTQKLKGSALWYAKDGYAKTTHRYAKPGDYLVTVSRTNKHGEKATARLYVQVH